MYTYTHKWTNQGQWKRMGSKTHLNLIKVRRQEAGVHETHDWQNETEQKGFKQGNTRLIQTQGLDNKKAQRLDTKTIQTKQKWFQKQVNKNSTYNNNPNLKS